MIFRVKFSAISGVDTHIRTQAHTRTQACISNNLPLLSIIGKKRLAEAGESSTRSSEAGESSTSATHCSKKPSKSRSLYSFFEKLCYFKFFKEYLLCAKLKGS